MLGVVMMMLGNGFISVLIVVCDGIERWIYYGLKLFMFIS